MTDLKRISDWFLAAAEVEAETPITVGATTVGPQGRLAERSRTEGLALAKLVELRRRQRGLSTLDLATQAGVDLEEVVSIEQGGVSVLEPRTVHQIARVLSLPERRLLELAGLAEAHDRHVREATVRFTARSEPIEALRPEELEALEEFVKVLVES